MDAAQVYRQPAVVELATAAQDGNIEKVRGFVASGADPNAQGDKGINLLQWSILHQNVEGLDALLKSGANPALTDAAGSTAMHYAAGAEDPRYLATLLHNGAPVDTRHGITGETPLFSALIGGRDVQFDMLVDAGADVDAEDNAGNHPLHVAGKVNNTRAVLVLLAKGAESGAKNGQGVTFMRYLALTPAAFRTAEANAQVEAIEGWLAAHGEPL